MEASASASDLLQQFLDRLDSDRVTCHIGRVRPFSVLVEAYPRTPAMAAGSADHIWTLEEIAALLG